MCIRDRLRRVQDRVDQVLHHGLCSGRKGYGAQDGWYTLGVKVERRALQGQHFALSALDLYKAFDQCCRHVVYVSMIKAGFPKSM
eukprot:996254-Alexandrium_andersonii.AAC.1